MASQTNPKEFFTETGVEGIAQSEGAFADRFLTKLQGAEGIQLMARVLRSEPAAYTLDNAIRLTAQQSTWSAKPAADTPGDQEAADFITSCLNDTSRGLWNAIQFALSGTAFGFADLFIVFKRRMGRTPKGDLPTSRFDDGLVGIRKLAIRRQETITKWIRDEAGDPKFMVQTDPESGKDIEPVPIERLLHFSFGGDRGSWEGIGWLEPAYRMAHMIQNLEVIYGIGQQRAHVGLPVFAYKTQPAEAVKKTVEAIARNLTVNEQQFVTYPEYAVSFDLMSIANPSAAETREMIQQLRFEIMMLGLGQFMRLGSTQSGARALADPLIRMFMQSVQGALYSIADTMNRHLVPRLLAANPQLLTKISDYPEIVPSTIMPLPTEVLQFLDPVARFLQTAPAEDQTWMRSIMGMPQIVVSNEPEDEEPGAEEPGAENTGTAQAGMPSLEFAKLVESARQHVEAAQALSRGLQATAG